MDGPGGLELQPRCAPPLLNTWCTCRPSTAHLPSHSEHSAAQLPSAGYIKFSHLTPVLVTPCPAATHTARPPRLATKQVWNSAETAAARPVSRGSSSYRGVAWNQSTQKWMSRIDFKNKQLFLGCYGTQEEAARAYDKAAHHFHGA